MNTEIMAADMQTVAQAEAISTGINLLFGFRPSVQYTDSKTLIRMTPEQNKQISVWFSEMMDSPQKPGDLDLDLMPIISPWIMKKVIPYALIALAIAGTIGYIIHR